MIFRKESSILWKHSYPLSQGTVRPTPRLIGEGGRSLAAVLQPGWVADFSIEAPQAYLLSSSRLSSPGLCTGLPNLTHASWNFLLPIGVRFDLPHVAPDKTVLQSLYLNAFTTGPGA